MTARHIALVGLMGAGKSTVGRALADRLGREFADTDDLIEAAVHCTVREYFASSGERAFRDLEGVVLDVALGVTAPGVIGCGGGIVTTAGNRQLLRDGRAFVVWLRALPEVLGARLASATDRPLLDGDRAARLAILAAEREQWYGEVADATVEVDARDVAGVVDAALEAVGVAA